MSLLFQPLGSGSHGNSVLIRNSTGAILIDAGLNWATMQQRLRAAGQPTSELAGVVLTHRHLDHTRSAGRIARRSGVPLYATERTAEHQRSIPRLERVYPGRPFDIAGFRLSPTRVSHDAPETMAYLVECDGLRIGVVTDLGSTGGALTQMLRDLDLLYLEFNYDPRMLREGPYEPKLQDRIASRRGHLSNAQAAHLLQQVASPRLRVLWQAHLSLVNNAPELAHEAARKALTRLGLDSEIRLALQHEVSTPSLLDRPECRI